MDKATVKYLERRASSRLLHGAQVDWRALTQAVVVPARSEFDALPGVLQSLAESLQSDEMAETIVVIVVNQPETAAVDSSERVENLETLHLLPRLRDELPYPLVWIDACSAGCGLPDGRGVGLARKLGADTVMVEVADAMGKDDAATMTAQRFEEFLVFHLDADCEVGAGYLQASRGALEKAGAVAGTIDVRHRIEELPAGLARRAAVEYECYLRLFVAGLEYAGSPYAFPTIGSAMFSTLSAYVKAGGVPGDRVAGEDFYFLQQLAKTGLMAHVTSTCVKPGCRVSDRVAFGTGPFIGESVRAGRIPERFYPMHCFVQLRCLLTTVAESANAGLAEVELRAALESGLEAKNLDFIERLGLFRVWPKFKCESKGDADRLLTKFHTWFDYLASVRFLNHACSGERLGLVRAWQEGAALLGFDQDVDDCESMLKVLRSIFSADVVA